ncbi:uncharacterized protein [Eurosta solidaginis]|uniref:uncharacterized protein n=1 Tax=Eurosta solidaginis TaxID=178769 RepID=UPI003530B3D5
MTDPWMVQNSGHDTKTEGNVVKENGAQQKRSDEESPLPHLEFEDNFTPIVPTINARSNCGNAATSNRNENISNSNGGCLEPLPDSDIYLRGLERKLQKIKKGANLVEALAEKRNDCLHQLLHSENSDNNNAVLALDEPLNNLEFCRHLQPIQALSVGELVHIVRYDQLQEQEEQQDNADKKQEIEKETDKEEQ